MGIKSFLFIAAAFILTSNSFADDKTSDGLWNRAFDAVNLELNNNLKAPSAKVPVYSARPSPKYDAVYLWDSAFIALIWKHRSYPIAHDIIRSVVRNQQADGRIPHVVSLLGISKWSQPPVLSWVAAQLLRPGSEEDLRFAREVYPKLKAYHEWLLRARRSANGLFFWDHAYESGIDNAPRFGNRDESKFVNTRNMEAIDLSSYAVMDANALAEIADYVDITDDALVLRAEAQRTAELVRENLWDEERGNFYDRDLTTGKLIVHNTIASLLPLTAGIASPEQAAKLLARVADPQGFNTPVPFPSVERAEPGFEKDCWRGPVWINMAYLAVQGMKRYGKTEEARAMAARLVDGVYKTWQNTGKFVEFYDTERFDFNELTRKKGTGFMHFLSGSPNPLKVVEHLVLKQIILGQKPVDHFIGWTGLVNNLVIEENLTQAAANPK